MFTKLFGAAALAASLSLAGSVGAYAQSNPMVGGAAMYADKNIIENAVNSKDHTTLVAAVKAAGLVDTLQSAGPFTVFAPTNAAFAALPEGTVETLLKPENKAMLVKILTAHVIAGNYSDADLEAMAEKNPEGFTLKTVSGDRLQFTKLGSVLYVVDESGNAAKITISNVNQSNGVIHVVNKVLLPK
ncbi:fasciclin domain-containing protein [Devosia sp. PTR5]|uniref:Fasciclin domain-containing protein n=1 Tax=Devosia oryzisoli TaxID=2774138 RepID=A0A927ITJ6_9HYPH|nr:fasciclin domain-containing protein [Devosia oryzisoli]MBD8066619.1 fasciclin domain-containing protein [Devosia oryzisoli]